MKKNYEKNQLERTWSIQIAKRSSSGRREIMPDKNVEYQSWRAEERINIIDYSSFKALKIHLKVERKIKTLSTGVFNICRFTIWDNYKGGHKDMHMMECEKMHVV